MDDLALENEKFRLMFENMNEGFVLVKIITDASGKPCDFIFLEMNPSAENLTGFTRKQIIGEKVSNILNNEPIWIERYGRVALSGTAECFEEFSTTLKKWYKVNAYQTQYKQCAVVFTDITGQKNNEDRLQKISYQLEERVKELNCLYSISKIVETKNFTIELLMQHIVDIIPPSFQFPDITCAKISINDSVYKSNTFKKTKWELSFPIHVHEQEAGYLEIFLIKNKLPSDRKMFLDEERTLLYNVCERVGKIIERTQGTKKLQEVETRYQLLTEQFADGIIIIQNNKYAFVNQAFSTMVGYATSKDLIGKRYHRFISKTHIDQYSKSIVFDAENTPAAIKYKLLSKNGNEIWVEEKRNVIDWDFSPALLCTLRDITENKEKEMSSRKEASSLRNENVLLRSSLKERSRFHNIVGASSIMQRVYDQILTAANSDANISIYGESGTGKELVARAIHDLSRREKETFVTINCGAIPEPLMESEFFGYKKGAFTGAAIDKHGFLDIADNGTLFLDEIGDLPLNLQVKLLRAVDGGGYTPIGSVETHMSNFRIIAATNKDLKEEVVKGNMREDFYYRIQVIPIHLPPLRNRKEDIPFLVEHFTRMFSKESQFKKVPDNIISKFYEYDWVGNIRELQNVLLRFFSTGQFELINLNKDKKKTIDRKSYESSHDEHLNLSQTVKIHEKERILKALKANNSHRANTAAQLGMSRTTLFRKIKEYDLKLKHM
ncbi:MAG: PAS domain S-box protein [Desulfobacteraceae bacterium]|nr:PAS domain S-box protein [Desulfobacteraceae bacterium]